MTKLDKILLLLLSFLFFFALFFSIVKNVAAAIFISFLTVILFRTIFIHFYVRRRNKSVISVAEMENALSIMGNEQIDYFFSIVPAVLSPAKKEGAIFFERNGEKVMIAPNYKFSPTGQDDAARFFRLAKKEKAMRVYVLGRYPNRQVLLLGNSFDIFFTFVTSKRLHAFLLKQNALMEKRKIVRTHKKKSVVSLLNNALTKKSAKYFALSGLTLVLFGLFTTLRVYYFVLGGICLLLTAICLFRKA